MHSNYTSSPAGIGYDKYPDRLDLFLSAETYQVINNTALRNESLPLDELAQTNANLAYKLTKSVLRVMAREGFDSITVNDVPVANKENNDPTDITASIGGTLIDNLPDADIIAFDYSISLYPSEEDIEILGSDPNDLITIVNARAEPPSLAA